MYVYVYSARSTGVATTAISIPLVAASLPKIIIVLNVSGPAILQSFQLSVC